MWTFSMSKYSCWTIWCRGRQPKAITRILCSKPRKITTYLIPIRLVGVRAPRRDPSIGFDNDVENQIFLGRIKNQPPLLIWHISPSKTQCPWRICLVSSIVCENSYENSLHEGFQGKKDQKFLPSTAIGVVIFYQCKECTGFRGEKINLSLSRAWRTESERSRKAAWCIEQGEVVEQRWERKTWPL